MLFFQEIVDDLSAVPAVGTITDMHPVGAIRIMLPDELVEVAVALDPIKPPFAFCHVAVDTEVCRLSLHVLTVTNTAHGIVKSQRTVAAAYFDGIAHRLPKRLQYVMHKGAQIDDIRLSWLVADALRLRRVACAKLFEREVLTDVC